MQQVFLHETLIKVDDLGIEVGGKQRGLAVGCEGVVVTSGLLAIQQGRITVFADLLTNIFKRPLQSSFPSVSSILNFFRPAPVSFCNATLLT